MRYELDKFSIIVLDVSIFFAELERSFIDSLKVYVKRGGKLYRYPAFSIELSELQKAADSNLLERSQTNMRNFSKFEIVDVKETELNNRCDCESLINFLLNIGGIPKSIAVATTNEIMKERLVLGNVNVSIINLENDRWSIVNPSQFREYEKDSQVLKFAKPVLLPYESVEIGDCLVRGDGRKVILTSIFHKGGKEAVLYNCNCPGFVAKVFKEGVLTNTKLKNICNFKNSFSDFPWLVCPDDILRTEKGNKPVGYIMKIVPSATEFSRIELFWGHLECLKKRKYRNTTLKHTSDICIAVIRQIMLLHMNGILFGDFNGSNFALLNSKSVHNVVFFDTDGYGYKENPVVCKAPDIENPRRYDLSNKKDIIALEYDNLYISVFTWLTVGLMPYVKVGKGKYRFRDWETETQQAQRLWQLLPIRLQKLFESVFEDGKTHTPSELLFALKMSGETIKKRQTYREYLGELLGIDTESPELPESEVAFSMPLSWSIDPESEEDEESNEIISRSLKGSERAKTIKFPDDRKKRQKGTFITIMLILIVIAIGVAVWQFGFKPAIDSQNMDSNTERINELPDAKEIDVPELF